MPISSWSTPFFPPQRRCIASFLKVVDVGISTTPTTLVTLQRNTPINTIPNKVASDDGTHLWPCPPVSPRSTGIACPILLYGAKMVPPTRAECQQETTTRQRHHKTGSGPNHCCSQRCHLRRNPPPVTQKRSLFCTPFRQRRLSDWAFPCIDNSHEAPEMTCEDDDADAIALNSNLHESSSIAWIDEFSNGAISWNLRPSPLAPPRDMPRSKPTAIIQRQASLSSSTSRGFIISKIFTQNAHGLRCCPPNQDGNFCPHDPHDYTRYKHLITTMKLKQLNVYFVQETWLEGDVFNEIINGYHGFHHNGKLGNHNFRGVAIILSPCCHEGWKAAGA